MKSFLKLLRKWRRFVKTLANMSCSSYLCNRCQRSHICQPHIIICRNDSYLGLQSFIRKVWPHSLYHCHTDVQMFISCIMRLFCRIRYQGCLLEGVIMIMRSHCHVIYVNYETVKVFRQNAQTLPAYDTV